MNAIPSIFGALLIVLAASSCSPLKSSPYDQKYQLELTLHEVQTNLDDLRHDFHCFQTELQILDGKIKFYETSLLNLKEQELEKHRSKLDFLNSQLAIIEKRWESIEKTKASESNELKQLTFHAKETSTALIQFKNRIEELERELIAGQKRFEDLAKLKSNIESLGKTLRNNDIYIVRPGDSLEKIAKFHKTSVEKLKKMNQIDKDLIVVGQELKIPTHSE